MVTISVAIKKSYPATFLVTPMNIGSVVYAWEINLAASIPYTAPTAGSRL